MAGPLNGPGPDPDSVSVTAGSGPLTSGAIVTGGGGTSLRTPSATSTLDASGNLTIPGTFTLGGNQTISVGQTTSAQTDLLINPTTKASGNLIDAQVNGVSKFAVASAGSITLGVAAALRFGAQGWINPSADGVLQITNNLLNGHRTLFLGATAPATIGAAPANGQTFSVLQASELLTIAAAASTTTTMLVPAGAVVLSVSVRVTVVIPTAATFTVSIGAISFQTAAVSTAANTTNVGTNPINTVSVYPYIASAAGVTITPNATPGAATGVVRVTVSYYLITPPTS